MRIASMARDSSAAMSVVHVRGREVFSVGVEGADPGDLQFAEVAGLVDVDQATLEQLEHGQEAHDDLQAFAVVAGELPEGGVPDSRKLSHELLQRVAHARPDGSHVV